MLTLRQQARRMPLLPRVVVVHSAAAQQTAGLAVTIEVSESGTAVASASGTAIDSDTSGI